MNEVFMAKAIDVAKKNKGDIPVGAIIVKDNKILSFACNKNNNKKLSTNHAEIIAIEKACKKLKTNKLVGCSLYVTKEPCLMCIGAIINSRIDAIYFGCYDKKYPVVSKLNNFIFNHKVKIVGGIKEQECAELLSVFFKTLRKRG